MPLQGIVLSIIFLKVTSKRRPNIPIIKIVIQITSYWKYFLATFSTNPIPVVPAKNSAATKVPQHIPTATLIPVKISGKEFGKITYLSICLLEAPRECAAWILDNCVPDAPAGASGTQLSKIHAAHSLGASKRQILRYVIFPNSLPEILTGIRVAVGMCWGTLVAAEFLAGTTGIGFVENVAKKYFQYEVIWITIFIMGMLGLLFDVTLRKIIDKTIPWRGKG